MKVNLMIAVLCVGISMEVFALVESRKSDIIPSIVAAQKEAAEQQEPYRELQEQERKEDVGEEGQLQQRAQEFRARRELLEKQGREQALRLQEIERLVEERRAEQRRREEEYRTTLEEKKRALERQKEELQQRKLRLQKLEHHTAEQKAEVVQQAGDAVASRIERRPSVEIGKEERALRVQQQLLKEMQQRRLPGLLKDLMEPLFTVLTVMNDKAARRNLRNIIKRFIQAINRTRPVYEGHISEDNPDKHELTRSLLQSVEYGIKPNQPLLTRDDDYGFVNLLAALHVGDLQKAILIAQKAYGGSYSFGYDFTIENFEDEYQQTLAGIVLLGMFERGKPFAFLLQDPQGNLFARIDSVVLQRDREMRQAFEDLDESSQEVLRDVRY